MWADADEKHVLINTEVHRQKFNNVERDPRVAVTIWDATNAYRFAELRGRVVRAVTGQEARDHIDKLSEKYAGRPYRPDAIQSERVILVIDAVRQYVRG